MPSNVDKVQSIIQRIRQKEGVGSDEDELALHRLVQDFNLLKSAVQDLQSENQDLESRLPSN